MLDTANLAPYDTGLSDVKNSISSGLQSAAAYVESKFFYDDLGSKLFEVICLLDEYHPTRSEAEIFEHFGEEIASCCGRDAAFIDLGAGNGEKAARLFSSIRPSLYVPVDISGGFLLEAAELLQTRFPELKIRPLIQDFSQGLRLPGDLSEIEEKLFFYPGSSLGNFAPQAAQQFLSGIAAAGGSLLLGVDITKNEHALKAAYDDLLGVTAAFNKNILRNVNGILGADFALDDWMHVAFFNPAESRVEMHLQANKALTVSWPEGKREFAKGERIHTENSYKFSRENVADMLSRAGFGRQNFWTDEKGQFLVCHAAASGRI